MESPYFTNHWSHPSHRRYYHAQPSHIPVHRARSSPVQKVVEIPVQYVSSRKPNRFDSAVKIQKVFRGYLVRKSVKKIDEIRRDVVEIENRVLKKESVEVIRNDAKERLRLNESLMSLLFKLDSVLGVDVCVREFRKRVIKRVIQLQEIVDEIVSSEQNRADVAGGELKEDDKAVETVTEEGARLETESNADEAIDDGDDVAGGESKEDVKAVETTTEEGAKLETESNADEAIDEDGDDVAAGGELKGNVEAVETITEEGAKLETKSDAEEAIDEDGEDVAGREHSDEVAVSISEGFEESMSQTDSNPLMEEEAEGKEECEEQRDEIKVEKSDDVAENKRSRELLERMVEDNEKMMGLMAELFERNEMQTRLLSALSQRVGQLERAFMCERLRKKKKKNGNGGLVDCVESTKDHCNNKCGGKKE